MGRDEVLAGVDEVLVGEGKILLRDKKFYLVVDDRSTRSRKNLSRSRIYASAEG